jgi:hypothetical protein
MAGSGRFGIRGQRKCVDDVELSTVAVDTFGFPVPWFSLETVERSRLWGSPVKPPDQTKTFILGLCLPDVIVLYLCLCLCHREAGCPLNPRYDTGCGE